MLAPQLHEDYSRTCHPELAKDLTASAGLVWEILRCARKLAPLRMTWGLVRLRNDDGLNVSGGDRTSRRRRGAARGGAGGLTPRPGGRRPSGARRPAPRKPSDSSWPPAQR